MMEETIYFLALFRFQCLPHYINKTDNEVSSYCVNTLEFFKVLFIVNCFVCWYPCNIYFVKKIKKQSIFQSRDLSERPNF